VSGRAPVPKAAGDESHNDAARYRRAAEEALRQIDFCAEYLRSIHKKPLANRLERNSHYIRKKFL
jgi:hypothetical protein